MPRRVILASSSPRRRELLSQAGIKFSTKAPGIDEDMRQKGTAAKLVKNLALQKGMAVATGYRNAVIIAADTVIAFGGKRWSKPESKKEARMMLTALSGKQHDVWTGFCIIDTRSGARVVRAVRTRVTFRRLGKRDIDRYLAAGHYDGAGSYQMQLGGNVLTAHISGDYNNIIGLPLAAVLEQLARFGVQQREPKRGVVKGLRSV